MKNSGVMLGFLLLPLGVTSGYAAISPAHYYGRGAVGNVPSLRDGVAPIRPAFECKDHGNVVLALYGQSSSRDLIIHECERRQFWGEKIIAYRMDNQTEIVLDRTPNGGYTGTGYVKNVFVYDHSQGKVIQDYINSYPLPTVFYGFDFYQYKLERSKGGNDGAGQMDRVPRKAGAFEPKRPIYELIETVNPAFLNTDEREFYAEHKEDPVVHNNNESTLLNPTNNEAVLYNAFKGKIAYPETYQYQDNGKDLGIFKSRLSLLTYMLSKYEAVFIKSVGGLKGKKASLYIKGFNTPTEKYFLITYKFKRVSPDGIATWDSNTIKASGDRVLLAKKIDLILATQFRSTGPFDNFVIQAAFKTPDLVETPMEGQRNQIRLISQRDGAGNVQATSMFAVIEGRRGMDGLVEDPRALIYSALLEAYRNAGRPIDSLAEKIDSVILEIKRIGVLAHQLMDQKSNTVRGEVVWDFYIDNSTINLLPIPLKARVKPEEIHIHRVLKDRRCLFSLDQKNRFLFDSSHKTLSFSDSERRRTEILVDYVQFLHRQKFSVEPSSGEQICDEPCPFI